MKIKRLSHFNDATAGIMIWFKILLICDRYADIMFFQDVKDLFCGGRVRTDRINLVKSGLDYHALLVKLT